jgi:hypothetical protein
MIEMPKIWKSLAIIVTFWVFYAIFGFEVSVVTLLAAILACFWIKSDTLF